MRVRAIALNDFFGAIGVSMHSTFCNIGHSRQSYTEDLHAGGVAVTDVTKSLIDMVGGCSYRTRLEKCFKLEWAYHIKKLDHFPIFCSLRSVLGDGCKFAPCVSSHSVLKVPRNWNLVPVDSAQSHGEDKLRQLDIA
eukprot:9717128-Karenia_brevis.AAC.1